MKNVFLFLFLWVPLTGSLHADEMSKPAQDTGLKPITIRGTLVDTSCYFSEGLTGNDHDGMTRCGTACLNSGVPAGVLEGDKVYILIFPSKAFANYVGQSVEIEGEAYGDNLIHPRKAVVIGKTGSKPIQLRGFEMM